MALEPTDDAMLELVGFGSHGSAVSGVRRFPERDIRIAALAGGEDHLRVVRRYVVVGEPVNEEHRDAASGNRLSGIVLGEFDAVFPARVENAGFDDGAQERATEPRPS